jgi:drug/metabolite transporter (DMT)-like permease
MNAHIGELAALATAVCWTVTALAFEPATRRIGPVAVNLLKLATGFVFLATANLILRGMVLPFDASGQAWLWLSLSGMVGFLIGDYFLFKSYTMIHARVSMLVMALAPPMAALLGWMFLGETLSGNDFVGMGLTLAGIAMVVLKRGGDGGGLAFKHPAAGVLLALGGAAGQAGGLVLSKYGMGSYSPLAATQIRVLAGAGGFALLFTALGGWRRLPGLMDNRHLAGQVALGSAFGPFLGVSLSLVAIQYTNTGVASTIMAMVPVMIIPPSVLLFKQRVKAVEVLGAVVSVAGVALLFLK